MHIEVVKVIFLYKFILKVLPAVLKEEACVYLCIITQHLAFWDCVCNKIWHRWVITYSLRSDAGRMESPCFNRHFPSSLVMNLYFDFCKGEHVDV